MFWCCLKALWDAGDDWKLSLLLKWVARELGLSSCHPLAELLSLINYFPCHLEQEWCHGSENSWRGVLTPSAYAHALYHVQLWIRESYFSQSQHSPSLTPFQYYILPILGSSRKYTNPRDPMRFPVWWHSHKILLTLPLSYCLQCDTVWFSKTQLPPPLKKQNKNNTGHKLKV